MELLLDTTKQIVYEISPTTYVKTMVIGDPHNLSIWDNDRLVGRLVTVNDGEWVRVRVLSIREEYRGRGWAKLMYMILFQMMPANEKGITNDIRTRHNNVQVPKLFARFGGYMDGNTVYIPKDGYRHEI